MDARPANAWTAVQQCPGSVVFPREVSGRALRAPVCHPRSGGAALRRAARRHERNVMPEQVLTGRAVAFDPATHGFAFPNAFVNEVLTLPNGARITTAGRCGGMAYAALDYFLAGQPVPTW